MVRVRILNKSLKFRIKCYDIYSIYFKYKKQKPLISKEKGSKNA